MGDLGISTRPGSAASLPVSTTSAGLLCLLVGAHVHRGRSDTEVECVATTMRISHLVHDIYMYITHPHHLLKIYADGMVRDVEEPGIWNCIATGCMVRKPDH